MLSGLGCASEHVFMTFKTVKKKVCFSEKYIIIIMFWVFPLLDVKQVEYLSSHFYLLLMCVYIYIYMGDSIIAGTFGGNFFQMVIFNNLLLIVMYYKMLQSITI